MYTEEDIDRCKKWCFKNLSNSWYTLCAKTLRVTCENSVFMCDEYGTHDFMNRIEYKIYSKHHSYHYLLKNLSSFDNIPKTVKSIIFDQTEKLDFMLFDESINSVDVIVIQNNSIITPKNLELNTREAICFYDCKNPEIYDFQNYNKIFTQTIKIDNFYHRIKNFTHCLLLENHIHIMNIVLSSNDEMCVYNTKQLTLLNHFLLKYMMMYKKKEHIMDMTIDLLDNDFEYECS